MFGSLVSAPGANALLSKNRVWENFSTSPLTEPIEPLSTQEPTRKNLPSTYDFASGCSKYLYTHGNPVNGTDPSGNQTLTEVSAIIGNLTKLSNIAFRVVNIYERAESAIQIVLGLNQIFKMIGSGLSMSDARTLVPTAGARRRVDLSEAGVSFLSMSAQAISIGSAKWLAGATKDHSKGRRIQSYLIYLANFIPLGREVALSTGLKIGKLPVRLVAGSSRLDGSGGLVGIGLQVGRNRTNSVSDNYQLFRMDWHGLDPSHGGASGLRSQEIAILHKNSYHTHVYDWGRKN